MLTLQLINNDVEHLKSLLRANMHSSRTDVLLIEDEESHAEIIERHLRRVTNGALELEWTSSLAEGLSRLRRKQFHAVLLDLHLPDSQGIESCGRVTKAAPNTPVIVLSSMEMDHDGIAAVEAHADDYLPKSNMNGELLVRAIRCATERAARRRAEADLHHAQGELAAARLIQTSLLPRDSPGLQGFELAGRSVPAEAVGGDCFDWQQLSSGDTLVTIGDASGHGTSAALIMAQATAAIRALAPILDDTSEIMSRVNQMFVHELPDCRFMTLLMLRIDQNDDSMRFCSAGHVPALLFDAQGTLRERLSSTGMPLGLLHDAEFAQSVTVQMQPGDTLILLTDGVAECQSMSSELFGEQRIVDLISRNIQSSPEDLIDELLAAADKHRGALPMADDQTVVVLRKDGEVGAGCDRRYQSVAVQP